MLKLFNSDEYKNSCPPISVIYPTKSSEELVIAKKRDTEKEDNKSGSLKISDSDELHTSKRKQSTEIFRKTSTASMRRQSVAGSFKRQSMSSFKQRPSSTLIKQRQSVASMKERQSVEFEKM